MRRSVSTFHFFAIIAVLFIVGCSAADKDTAQNTAQIMETDVTTSELPGLVGEYQGTSGRLIIRADGTYTALRTQEISLRTGSTSKPTRDIYPVCSTVEFGRLTVSKGSSQTSLNFVADQTDVVSVGTSRRGTKDFDFKAACELYVASYKGVNRPQRFEMAAPGVISLRAWKEIARGTYKDEPTYFSLLSESPSGIGEMFGLTGKQIDVTSFLTRYLGATKNYEREGVKPVIPKHDFNFDPSSKRFAYINNECGFEVTFKAAVTFKNGEMKISPEDLIVIRDIDNQSYKKQDQTSAPSGTACDLSRKDFENVQLKESGFKLAITSWMTFEVTSGSIRIQKVVPDALAVDER